MDKIVLEQANGELRSSSFHVRFSSAQALTSDIDILIYVNNKKVDVKMKLAKSGDGYFYSKNLDENSLDKSNLKLDGENEDYIYRDSHIKMLKDNKYCTLFPIEEQIKKMNLKYGKNDIYFVVETYWGEYIIISFFIIMHQSFI